MDVCARLMLMMQQQKLSQKELASIIGVSSSYVSQMFARKKSVSLEMIMRFCNARGIALAHFFNDDVPPDKIAASTGPDIFEGLTDIQVRLVKQLISQIRLAKAHNDEICFKVPQGVAAAGIPIYSPSTDDTIIQIPEKYLDGRFFVVTARGDSMIPRIANGDHVVVQKDTPGDIGDIVLAKIAGQAEDEYMIKRLHRKGAYVEFHSFNPAYDPIKFKATDVLSVQKIVHIIER